jgi:hydrogenase maturation protease
MSTRIIGLGNSILTDDGVGIHAVREVRRCLEEACPGADVDIVETEVGGFFLMELMAGWNRIILVDSIQFDGLEPGTVVRINPCDLHTSLRLRSVHEIDLPTVLELGCRLGLPMPENVSVIGIQAKDALTFGESLTDAAERGLKEAVSIILGEIRDSKFLIRDCNGSDPSDSSGRGVSIDE